MKRDIWLDVYVLQQVEKKGENELDNDESMLKVVTHAFFDDIYAYIY